MRSYLAQIIPRFAVGLVGFAVLIGAPTPAAALKGHHKAKPDAAEAVDGAPDLHRVRGGARLEVKARDLRLRDADEKKLRRIADRYFAATRKRLIVTGGTRTPERQAQLMVEKLRHGDDIVNLYENKAAAQEIKGAYDDGAAKGQGRKATVKAVAQIIKAQMGHGVFVSKHLQSGAVDVRSWGMNTELEGALKAAVKEEPGVTMLDERKGPEPHFHLSLGSSEPARASEPTEPTKAPENAKAPDDDTGG